MTMGTRRRGMRRGWGGEQTKGLAEIDRSGLRSIARRQGLSRCV